MNLLLGVDIDGTICEWPEKVDPDNSPDILDLEPYQDSVQTLHMLRNNGIDIVYITFRSDWYDDPEADTKQKTLCWLEKFMFPNPQHIHFGNEFVFKHEMLKKLGAFGIVEDDALVCERATNFGFHAFLHTQPWYNRDYMDVEEGLFHTFNSWKELGEMVLGVAERIA